MFKQYKLRKNHSTALPGQIVYVSYDLETDSTKSTSGVVAKKLSFGIAVAKRYRGKNAGKESQVNFQNVRYFWDWLQKTIAPDRTTWVIIHNAGIFAQVSGLFAEMDSGNFRCVSPGAPRENGCPEMPEADKVGGVFVLSDPPVIIGLEGRNGGRLLWLDSRNWADLTLAEMAGELGTERISTPTDRETRNEQFTRILRDLDILEGYVHRILTFWDDNKFGMFRWTASGLSLAAFRHKYYRHEIVIHEHTEAKKLERDSYRGGETRVFRAGEYRGRFWQLDVNNLFGHAMAIGLYPVRLRYFEDAKDWRGEPFGIEPMETIAEVAIESPDCIYGVKRGRETSYTYGRFYTVLAGPELEQAIKAGHVKWIRRYAVYELAPLFRDFVAGVSELRREYSRHDAKIEAKLCKRLIVGLYGKFAQRQKGLTHRPKMYGPDRWGPWYLMDRETGKVRRFQSIAGLVFEDTESDDCPHTFTAISSYITAYARLYMDRLRQVAGNYSVYYQGIDSLIVDDLGYDRLDRNGYLDPLVTGLMKIEATAEDLSIHGVADYQIGAKQVMGWVPKGGRQVIDGGYKVWQSNRLASIACTMPDQSAKFAAMEKRRGKRPDNCDIDQDGFIRYFPCNEWRVYPCGLSASPEASAAATTDILSGNVCSDDLG